MPEPHLRAADSDRIAVASVLGEHMAAGRLTLAEYDERVTRAYAAKTYGELAELTTDLPKLPNPATAAQPATSAGRPSPAARGACGPAYRGSAAEAWRAWVTTTWIIMTIWLLGALGSGGFHHFWPIWVIGPWAAVLLARTLGGGGGRRHGHRPGLDPRSGS
jgi:Domain of unknown function (DUF1707)